MTTESEAISHLRAIIKDPLGRLAEACEFLASLDHIADAGKMVADGRKPIPSAWAVAAKRNPWFDRIVDQNEE